MHPLLQDKFSGIRQHRKVRKRCERVGPVLSLCERSFLASPWQASSQAAPMSTMQWASEKPFAASYPSSPTSTMHPTYFAQQYASFAAPPPPAPTGTTNWQQGLQQADHRPPPLVRQNAFWR